MESDLKQLIELEDILSVEDFRELLSKVPISILLQHWDVISKSIAVKIFDSLSTESKVTLLINLPPVDVGELLLQLNEEEIKQLLTEIEPDDLADIIQMVDQTTRQTIWNGLSDESKMETLFLLKFDEDDAAGLMTPRFLAIRASLTVKQALDYVRKRAGKVETILYIYVIDYLKRLIGVVSLKDLLSNKDDTQISDIMEREVISVSTHTDQELVAQKLETYDLVALPVIDEDRKLLGIVTFDDIIDVIREEHTEDIYKMQAMNGNVQRYMDLSPFKLVLKRVPWLIILLLLGTVTTWVMDHYLAGGDSSVPSTLSLLFPAIIGIYVPIILGTGGNTGGQSSTLIIRGLATGEIHFRDTGTIILKELLVGLILALIIGIVIFARSLLIPPHASLLQAGAITTALAIVVILSNLIGAIAPMLISMVKLDPAVMSTPLMSTVIDVCGLVIYFEIARAFLV